MIIRARLQQQCSQIRLTRGLGERICPLHRDCDEIARQLDALRPRRRGILFALLPITSLNRLTYARSRSNHSLEIKASRSSDGDRERWLVAERVRCLEGWKPWKEEVRDFGGSRGEDRASMCRARNRGFDGRN